MTAQALTALAGKPFPIAPAARWRARPRSARAPLQARASSGVRRYAWIGDVPRTRCADARSARRAGATRRERAHAPGRASAPPLASPRRCASLALLALRAGSSPSSCRRPTCKDAVALHDFTLLEPPARRLRWRTSCCTCSTRCCSSLWGVALVAVALAARTPARRARGRGSCWRSRRSPPSCSSRCSPTRTRSVGDVTSAPPRGRAATRPPRLALALCAVLVAPPRLRPLVAALGGAVRGWPSAARC